MGLDKLLSQSGVHPLTWVDGEGVWIMVGSRFVSLPGVSGEIEGSTLRIGDRTYPITSSPDPLPKLPWTLRELGGYPFSMVFKECKGSPWVIISPKGVRGGRRIPQETSLVVHRTIWRDLVREFVGRKGTLWVIPTSQEIILQVEVEEEGMVVLSSLIVPFLGGAGVRFTS